jgi:NAD(P)-dependent dehydrogenase (short-subunit alcohol dehydrogenase family)
METAPRPELTGQSVVITGAAGGIGSAVTGRFLGRGARVFATDRDHDALAALQRAHPSSNLLSTASLDVSDENRCGEFAARLRAEWGRVDVLVNAAGYFPLTPFEEITHAQWREIVAINLDGPFLVARSLLPLLKASRAGRIIFFSSASIYAGMPEQCPYVSAKAGVIGLTRSLAKVVGKYGITVNAITPGLTLTAPVKKLFPADVLEQAAQARALERDERAEDLVGAVYFLASEDAAFITGQIINVDGGAEFH